MALKKAHWGLIGVAVVALAAGGYYLSMKPSAGGTSTDIAVATVPVGITFEPLGAAQGYATFGYRFARPPRNEVVYSNEKGLTLYTYDKDEPGKSNCTADCAKTWIPATPIAAAKPVPGWTVISREDGSKQWAVGGKPLYTFAKDREGGDVGGAASMGGGGGMGNAQDPGKPRRSQLEQGWHTALFKTGGVPTLPITPPRGIKLEEVTDANGVVLTDVRDMTLYAYTGDVNADQAMCGTATCKNQFTPLPAPGLAHPTGDWSVVTRKDGIDQWAYKGHPLYTYQGDQVIGDVNGGDVDKRWRTAVVGSEFLPANVKITHNLGRGVMLTTPDGMTLYRREAKAWLNVGGSAFQLHDWPYRPKVGRSIRSGECGTECLKTWKPYLAPADAEPIGNWGVYVRPDGTKQWTYKDYTLYTYAGDKKPGDMTGDDIYDVVLSDNPNQINDIGYPEADIAALYWMFVPL